MQNRRFKPILVLFVLLALIVNCVGCAQEDTPEPTTQLIPHKVELLTPESSASRPMITINNVPEAIAVLTDSTLIEGNIFSYWNTDSDYQAIDASGIIYKAANVGDSMVLSVNKLTLNKDILSIISSQSLVDSKIQYVSNSVAMSFAADTYSMVDVSFDKYYLCTIVEKGNISYALTWQDQAGNILKAIRIDAVTEDTCAIEVYYDGEKFILQTDTQIIDPKVSTLGLRSSDYETVTIYPCSASRYEISIFEDGTASFQIAESPLIPDEETEEDVNQEPDDLQQESTEQNQETENTN